MSETDDSTRRVAIVSQKYPPEKGGGASRIYDNSRYLKQQGIDVTVVCPFPSYPRGKFDRTWSRTDTDEIDGVSVRRLWTWQPVSEDPGFLQRLFYYILFAIHATFWLLWNREEFDVVLTTSPPIFTGLPGLVLSKVFGTKTVVDVRDLWIDVAIDVGLISSTGLPAQLSRWFESAVLHEADLVLVTTPTIADELQRHYGLPGAEFVTVPNGVDTGLFQPADQTESSSDTLELAYTGNIGYAKSLDDVIRALDRVDDLDVSFTIVGEGDNKEDLERLASRLGVDDRVEFVGLVEREKVPEYLNSADVGVAPLKTDSSLEYCVPIKLYEYFACNLTVLATGRGEIETAIEKADSGVVADTDPDDIADRLRQLYEKWENDSLDSNARGEYVCPTYDREHIATNLADQLDDV